MTKAGLIYGRHPVEEALRSGTPEIASILLLAGTEEGRLAQVVALATKRGIAVRNAGRGELDRTCGHDRHQGVVARVAAFAYVELEDLLIGPPRADHPDVIVALDEIQDPHNLGALARSAFALGARGLLLGKHRSCEVTAGAMKASAGALAHLRVARVTNLKRAFETLKAAGYWIVGAAAEGEELLWDVDLSVPTVLVVGSEGAGMRTSVMAACDRVVRIPMPGELGSLNASVAGSVLLYEALRQRSRKG